MTEDRDRVVEELATIRKLLVIAILKSGMSQRELAKALGVNQSSISRMMAKG